MHKAHVNFGINSKLRRSRRNESRSMVGNGRHVSTSINRAVSGLSHWRPRIINCVTGEALSIAETSFVSIAWVIRSIALHWMDPIERNRVGIIIVSVEVILKWSTKRSFRYDQIIVGIHADKNELWFWVNTIPQTRFNAGLLHTKVCEEFEVRA